MGYLHLCRELECRTEAFSTICQLDDISLLEEPDGKNKKKKESNISIKTHCSFFVPPGVEPRTIEEWKLLIQLSQRCSSSNGDSEEAAAATVNGSSRPNGLSADRDGKINPESLTLLLARVAGPDRATQVLEECGMQLVLSPHSRLVCELLRVAEKRQRWV